MRRLVLTPLVLCLLPLGAHGEPQTYDFRAGGNAAGHPAYDAATGFGFEAATQFSIRVPEGNYRVTVRLAPGRRALAALDLLAEQRRLMAQTVTPDRSLAVERQFIVNVRTPTLGELPPNAPGGTQVHLKTREMDSADWDDKLTLEFLPDPTPLESISVERVELPTLYLAGDSTVTDQPLAPDASWGQRLPALFAPEIAIANHAESGETLKSFVTEQRLDKLLSRLRAGDWVMIQFGHNDQKTQWAQTYSDAATTYRAWLRTYLAEIRRRGATPLLVTSPERRNFDDTGHIVRTLGDYPEAMRIVAREERVALIDLNEMSIRVYEALGPQVAPRAFADGGNDRTHFDEYGADLLARCVVAGLLGAREFSAGLETHLSDRNPHFDPDHPELPK
jgi:lysophospholipase L1-like esterase